MWQSHKREYRLAWNGTPDTPHKMEESQKHHLSEILKQAKLVYSHRKQLCACLGLEVVKGEREIWAGAGARNVLYLDYGDIDTSFVKTL